LSSLVQKSRESKKNLHFILFFISTARKKHQFQLNYSQEEAQNTDRGVGKEKKRNKTTKSRNQQFKKFC